MTEALREVPRQNVLELAARAARSGADRTTLLGAGFLAAVREIRPLPVGRALHSAMMIESVLVLTEDAPPEEAWPAVLWALDDVKEGQERDAAGGDWKLPTARAFEGEANEATLELRHGLDGFDPERAERAVVTLARSGRAADAFEVIWPYAGRSFADAGHRAVFVSQAERVMRRLGPEFAEDGLRSIVMGLANDVDGEQTASYHSARELAVELPEGWERGLDSPARSLEVLRAVRLQSPRASQEVVVAACKDGIASASVWDGLRLYAAELVLLRPERRRMFPIHCTTELEALGHAFGRARSEVARRLILLEAAAWMAEVRAAVTDNNGAYDEGGSIDSLGEDMARARSVEAALQSRSAARIAATLNGAPGRCGEALALWRRQLVPRAGQNHQYKFLAAVLEESRRVHPSLRARIVAAGADFLPASSESVEPVYRRAIRALEAAGVL